MYQSLSFSSAVVASFLATAALSAPTTKLQQAPRHELVRRGGTAGCGIDHTSGYKTNPSGGGQGYTVQSGGRTRYYTINIPSSYDKNTPMGAIISYHGNGGTSDGQHDLTQFGDETWNPNLISVYPLGVSNSWEGAGYAVPGVDDVLFTQDLIDHLNSQYCIDTTRYYASGKSNGGGFVDTLACSDVGAKFAAFSSCSGAFYTDNNGNYTDCKPSRSNLPYLEFHGSADDVIPYDGVTKSSGTTPPIPDWLARWGERNGCGSSSDDFQHDGAVNHTTYACPDDTAVEAYWIQGMNHDWPSTSSNSDNQAHGDGPTVLDATPLIVDFYNRFHL